MITSFRVGAGWGSVTEDDWPGPHTAENWPPREPLDLDAKAKLRRVSYYQRIRTAQECRAALKAFRPVAAAFEITEQWFDAPEGIITMPPDGARIEGSHCVDFSPFLQQNERLVFPNSWGEHWGHHGHGQLSDEFFDRWLIDAWTMEGVGHYPPPFAVAPGIQQLDWSTTDFIGRRVHVREMYDQSTDERMAWTFVVERDGFRDVEEFYVRPQYRRQGHGKALLYSLVELAQRDQTNRLFTPPLRFWIPFADCAEDNLDIFERMLHSIGYSLDASPVRWAAYSTQPRLGVERPPMPQAPSRPSLCLPKDYKLNGTHQAIIPHEFPVWNGAEQPDWTTNSDEAFLKAAKAVFERNASLLRRLA